MLPWLGHFHTTEPLLFLLCYFPLWQVKMSAVIKPYLYRNQKSASNLDSWCCKSLSGPEWLFCSSLCKNLVCKPIVQHRWSRWNKLATAWEVRWFEQQWGCDVNAMERGAGIPHLVAECLWSPLSVKSDKHPLVPISQVWHLFATINLCLDFFHYY